MSPNIGTSVSVAFLWVWLGGFSGLLFLPNTAHSQTIEWIRQFGSTSNDWANRVAVDTSGVYVAGLTNGALPGQTSAGLEDAFLRKYEDSGNELWTRQFGSESSDVALGVAVNATDVYVVAYTKDTLLGGTVARDAFVGKYDTNGNESWTRPFGSTSYDEAWGVAVDATGVYVAGITGGALPGQTSVGGDDAFVRKYDFSGNLLWTHQFGTSNPDSARGVAVDAAGVYVVGTILSGSLPGQTSAGNYDAFVRKYDSNGNELWTRQFGTASPDQARGVAVDATSVYIVGGTNGALPGQTSAGSSDAFVRRYDANGTELWTRQFGSSSFGFDEALGVAVDSTGVYVTGTAGGTLPGQTSAGAGDAFVRKYDATGAELWTLQFGSDNFFSSDWAYGVAVDTSAVYVGGRTTGTLPGQTSAGGQDAFVVKIVEPSTGPAVSDGGVVNHASFAPSPAPVALGSIAAVFGTNLNDGSTTVATSFGPDGKLGTALGGASVTINNTPAPMFYSTPGQLGIQIPFELTGLMSATIVVTVGGQSSVSRTINLDAVAPGIFTLTSDGEGAAAALHENGLALVTAGNPAHPGELVVLFATGLGAVTPPLATGTLSTGNQTVAIPAVTIDGIPGNVEFSGTVPGSVGLNLIRVRIPLATHSAPDIPVVLTIDGKQSNEVTIAVSP